MILELADLADRKLQLVRQRAVTNIELWRRSIDATEACAKWLPDKFNGQFEADRQLSDEALASIQARDYLSILEIDRSAVAGCLANYSTALEKLRESADTAAEAERKAKEQAYKLTSKHEQQVWLARTGVDQDYPSMLKGLAGAGLLFVLGALGCLRWPLLLLSIVIAIAVLVPFLKTVHIYHRLRDAAAGDNKVAELYRSRRGWDAHFRGIRQMIDWIRGDEADVVNSIQRPIHNDAAREVSELNIADQSNYPDFCESVRQLGLTFGNLIYDYGKLTVGQDRFFGHYLCDENPFGSLFEFDEEAAPENWTEEIPTAVLNAVRQRRAQLPRWSQERGVRPIIRAALK
jgi:hypothetical protein